MRAGIFQSRSDLGGPEARLQSLAEVLGHAGQLDLLLCPELYQCGYIWGPEVQTRAEPVDGPFAAGVADLARRHDTAIAYGFAERASGLPYNSAACFGPDGRLLAHRRKCVLPPGPEQDLFQPGPQGTTVFDLNGVRVGLVICYEIEFPESVRAAATDRAEVVLAPTAISTNWPLVPDKLIPTRAFENGVWVLYANHSGAHGDLQFAGRSCITAPFGDDAARASKDAELIVADLDMEEVQRAQARLPFLVDAARLAPA